MASKATKQTRPRVSAIAGRLLSLSKRRGVRIEMRQQNDQGNTVIRDITSDVVEVAASALSQDERAAEQHFFTVNQFQPERARRGKAKAKKRKAAHR